MSNEIKLHTDPALQHNFPGPRTAREWARIWQQVAERAPNAWAKEQSLVTVEHWLWMAECDEIIAQQSEDEER